MYKIILVLCLFTSPLALATSQAKVHVSGMVCALCAQGVIDSLKEQKEVRSVDVNMDDKTVTLQFKDGQNLEDSKIGGILSRGNYTVERVER